VSLGLDAIRDCLEGAVPGVMATCAPDGTPNVAYLSQVEYVDPEHLALSFQFFNKTRENVLVNPQASLLLVRPRNGAMFRLSLRYLRTETAGPLFERMKAKLAGIAAHTGMSGVFQLRGSDLYRVLSVEPVPSAGAPAEHSQPNLLPALRRCSARLAKCGDLDALLDQLLDGVQREFGIGHAMVLLLDPVGERLYTVASRGYSASGVGSEIALGEGVIGVAARERTPIRIGYMTAEYGYGRAIRDSAAQDGMVATEIPLPGLPESRSQLAVPIVAFQRLLGVLYVESAHDLRFSYDDEDALVMLASQLGIAMHVLQAAEEAADEPDAAVDTAAASGTPVTIRHYPGNDSVFLDQDYLIKGVAGAIFWTLVQDYVATGRTVFSNRELRLDPRIRLPDLSDNLEARLILLRRRLQEHDACVRIEKTGRGRFQLVVTRPLQLAEMKGAAPA